MGIVGAGMMSWYIWRCTQDHNGFDKAFGADWSDNIHPQQATQMVQKRWSFYLKMNGSPEPIWERDKAFWTIPGTKEQLLCDIWRPSDDNVSGLAFIYFHGSGWYIGDKDVLTRPFFRHLVAQGHTVMDVAYRLCPEVDIYGMIGDAKRAIAWMKTHASRYGVNPEKIVLGGGSAGGHLAQLAGYTPGHPELTPADVKHVDLSVCGVISYYGPSDMLAEYQYLNLQGSVNLAPVAIGKKFDFTNRFRLDPEFIRLYAGRLDTLLGGHPDEAPDKYELASPSCHVNPDCPPTLLIQGQQDFITSVDTTCTLYTKLVEAGVPTINIIYPCTDHGFDLAFPQVNPAAQSALYDVDRFLAILSNDTKPKIHTSALKMPVEETFVSQQNAPVHQPRVRA